jgi:hypothetical protein
MDQRGPPAEHDRLVGLIAGTLLRRGERGLKANVSGYPRPDPIRWKGDRLGHYPDLTAEGLVVEVETAELLGDEQTAQRWKLSAGYADRTEAAFIVVVPRGSEADAQHLLDVLGLEAQVVGS